MKTNIPDKIRQQLTGNFQTAKMFEEETHVFGTYIRRDMSSHNNYREPTVYRFRALGVSSKQSSNIHLNTGNPENRMMADIMTGVIYGGTWMSYWSGFGAAASEIGGRETDPEQQSWYNDLPILKTYVNKLLTAKVIGSDLDSTFSISDVHQRTTRLISEVHCLA